MRVHAYQIAFFSPSNAHPLPLPLFALPVECGITTTGFTSPADDYIEARLDLNNYHRIRQNTTFLVKATGESMSGVGITDGDILIVDTRLSYRAHDVVVCRLNDCYKAKKLETDNGQLYLVSCNPAYPPIAVHETDDLQIFGVVTGLTRSFRCD